MPLRYAPYLAQQHRWPQTGRQILAQYDETSVIVYQAYRPSIGKFAAQHGYFGGEFSFSRMSWIKTNFLWMMYRSGWGSKEGQEITLAIRLKRDAFDMLLAQVVHARYIPEIYHDEVTWKALVEQSAVRLQWDPDHDPTGAKLARRALQLGLRGEILKQYAHEWIIEIEDLSELVRQQADYARTQAYTQLITPYETVYPVSDQGTAFRLGIEPPSTLQETGLG
jgi:hypothetical protein